MKKKVLLFLFVYAVNYSSKIRISRSHMQKKKTEKKLLPSKLVIDLSLLNFSNLEMIQDIRQAHHRLITGRQTYLFTRVFTLICGIFSWTTLSPVLQVATCVKQELRF